MNHKLLHILLLLMLALPFASCQDHSAIQQKLDEAENWMDEHPDLALKALKTIEPSELIRDSHQARYALLYSQALDKNYIDLTNDSLINIAVDYYHDTDDVPHKFLSYYYKGRIHQNAKEYPEAMLAYLEAEQLTDAWGNDYYAGLLCQRIAHIYRNYHDHPKALKYHQRSYSHFERADKSIHCLWGELDIALIYRDMNDDEKAFQILEEGLSKVEKLSQHQLIRNYLGDLILICLNEEQWDDARKYYDRFIQYDDPTGGTPGFIGAIAKLHTHEGDFKQAKALLNIGWEKASNRDDSIHLYHESYLIHEKRGDYRQACEDLVNCIDLQNKQVRVNLQQPILTTQMNFLRQEMELQQIKAQSERRMQVAGIGLLVVLAGIALYSIRKKLQQRVLRIQDEKNRLKEHLELLQTTHEHTETLKNDLFESKMKELDKLVLVSLKEFKNEESRNRAILKLVQDIKNQFHGNKKSIANLEKLVNEYQDNVMLHLRAEIALPEESYYEMVCYLLANFSVNTIALLLDETTNTIYKRRERVRSLIQTSSAPHKEQFLQI